MPFGLTNAPGSFQRSVDYLGHMIGPNGLQMDPAKVKVIQDWPEP
jgi:hypothetical protein